MNEIHHVALVADWDAAQPLGAYTTSTRGRSLEEEGFVHCSFAHQVDAIVDRFYGDLDQVVVLRIDADALKADVVVEEEEEEEDLLDAGEAFPHVYGPIPVEAVVGADVRDVAAMRPDDGR